MERSHLGEAGVDLPDELIAPRDAGEDGPHMG